MVRRANSCNHGQIATIGIGAMIVFIAMVLVAGIAASILIQTAGDLERRGVDMGKQTTAEVSTGLRVMDVEGHYTNRSLVFNKTTGLIFGTHADDKNPGLNGTWINASRIHNMTITVAPRAGSMDIDLSTTILEISNASTKCILTYDSTYFNSVVSESGVFSTQEESDTYSVFDLGPDDFGIIELEDADGTCSASNPVINRGDKIMLTVNLSACFSGLTESTNVWGTIKPEDGAMALFSFRVPASLSDAIYDLF